MTITTSQALALLITNPVFRTWVKKPTADALAYSFGCTTAAGVDVDPTVGQVLALTDQQIIDAPYLDKAAVTQVHALRTAIYG